MVVLTEKLEQQLADADAIDGNWLDDHNRQVVMETLNIGYNIVKALNGSVAEGAEGFYNQTLSDIAKAAQAVNASFYYL